MKFAHIGKFKKLYMSIYLYYKFVSSSTHKHINIQNNLDVFDKSLTFGPLSIYTFLENRNAQSQLHNK